MKTKSSKLSGDRGAVFGLNSCTDMHEKLSAESTRLEAGWHPYDAFNFVVTAWHLHKDWVGLDGSPIALSKRDSAWAHPQTRLFLEVLRDLATGSKHFALRSSDPRRVDAVHTGEEVGWWQYFFHEDIPGVTVAGSYFSIRVLRNIAMEYFAWLLDDTKPAQLPCAIVASIEYCHIPTRKGSTPELWLRGTPVYRRAPKPQ